MTLRSRPEFHSLVREYVAPDDAIQYDIRHRDTTVDVTALTDAQRRVTVRVCGYAAVDGAVDVATALEVKITTDSRIGTHQRVDDGVPALFTS